MAREAPCLRLRSKAQWPPGFFPVTPANGRQRKNSRGNPESQRRGPARHRLCEHIRGIAPLPPFPAGLTINTSQSADRYILSRVRNNNMPRLVRMFVFFVISLAADFDPAFRF